jgi:hypothetical protein
MVFMQRGKRNCASSKDIWFYATEMQKRHIFMTTVLSVYFFHRVEGDSLFFTEHNNYTKSCISPSTPSTFGKCWDASSINAVQNPCAVLYAVVTFVTHSASVWNAARSAGKAIPDTA